MHTAAAGSSTNWLEKKMISDDVQERRDEISTTGISLMGHSIIITIHPAGTSLYNLPSDGYLAIGF